VDATDGPAFESSKDDGPELALRLRVRCKACRRRRAPADEAARRVPIGTALSSASCNRSAITDEHAGWLIRQQRELVTVVERESSSSVLRALGASTLLVCFQARQATRRACGCLISRPGTQRCLAADCLASGRRSCTRAYCRVGGRARGLAQVQARDAGRIWSRLKQMADQASLTRHPPSVAEVAYLNARTANCPERRPPPSARREGRARSMQSRWQ